MIGCGSSEVSKTTWPPLLRYLAVGVLNTCVGLGVIYAAMYFAHLGNVAANLIGYIVGAAFSFFVNKYWTFSNRNAAGPQFVRFVLVLSVAYLVNLAAVTTLVNGFEVNPYIAQALGTAPYTTVGYLGSRYFAFRPLATLA
jgi:putative flippase GtrA